ncbi:MAG TPA: aminotransferase class I/II-fold pyridoxal phosphate-dependent enzyme [Thermoplasmata archaeon]|nr:aminotransferase class I/II-fold pyridoxal phosphate-dependent enzyme [Thermoplasmata archaeon]
MKFPLADWIDDHDGCRHNLGASGMRGSIRRLTLARGRRERPEASALVEVVARSVGVDTSRVFLTHGATEANAWVTFYLARSHGAAARSFRVRFPEYPPLFDVAREAGLRLREDARPVDLAVVSQPRNPEGDLWPVESLIRWADGATHLLADETFREFAGTRSLAVASRPRLWTTGSLTKFYGADDVRLGYAIAPADEAPGFARFVGLVGDSIADSSVAAALHLLERGAEIHAQVDRLMARNVAALRRAFPRTAGPVAPVFFDRNFTETGDNLARRCLRASVLVCPGTFFGDPGGVRLCLTRRSFPNDLGAYLRVRNSPKNAGASTGRRKTRRGR